MRGRALRARLRLLAAASLLVVTTACGGGEGAGSDRAADTAATPAPAGAEPASPERMRGDTVVVEMDEYVIDAPDTLPAGRLVLEVRNMGFEEHNLEVHRDSLLFESGRPLNPRETRIMEVVLDPGPHRLVCTVSGHEGRGMIRALTVVEAPPDT